MLRGAYEEAPEREIATFSRVGICYEIARKRSWEMF